MKTINRVILVCSAAILSLSLGCSADPNDTDDDADEVTGQTSSAIDLDLPLTPFVDTVKPYSTRHRDVIRSASEYQYYIGHVPPAWIDFSRQWVVFATTGTKPTDGYEMHIERARFFSYFGYSFYIYFREVAPGPTCPVNATPFQADALATVPIPPSRPRRTRFQSTYETRDCTTANP